VIRNVNYQPSFPYFGGKSPVADRVWAALGDVGNYVEPFCGSCAVLMLRPGGAGHIETVNDTDGLLANFWRALQKDSDAVAIAADNPVNECDLHARHLWLVGRRERITEKLCGDPDWFDARAAGWWAWGLCCWIGGGWCSGTGPWRAVDGEMVLAGAANGVARKRPSLSNGGRGVSRQLPHLGPARGVSRRRPQLGDTGKGVNRKLPHLGSTGQGECADRREWLRGYLGGIADRLRGVRVCCGDWQRVCGPAVTHHLGMTGVFLDPPYADTAGRTANVYAKDCLQVAHRVREWAIEEGKNPLMRIILAGYDGEHEMPDDWRVESWQTSGGYGNIGGSDAEGTGRANAKKERLWFSPACLKDGDEIGGLFASSPATESEAICPQQ